MTSVSGTEIRKEAVAPLVAPCLRSAIPAGRTLQEQSGRGIPRTAAETTDPAMARKTPAPTAAATVGVHVNATPWAHIEIDGKPIGTTPLGNVPLTVGEHEVVGLGRVGYQDGEQGGVESREPEQYYTAGLMINQEVPLPVDYDLTVVEAVTRVGGPLFNGGFGGSNLQGSIVQSGLGNPSPTLLTILRHTLPPHSVRKQGQH